MTRVRILAALAAAVLALSVLPASAQDDPTDGLDDLLNGEDADEGDAGSGLPTDDGVGARFIATADGGGFIVTLAGESLTLGESRVGIQSAPDGEACDNVLACASGAGEALLGETAEVAISEGSASDESVALDLSLLEPLATGGVGPAFASARVADGVTAADAQGGVAELSVTLTQELLDNGLELEDLLESLLGGDLDPGLLDELIGELENLLDLDDALIGDILADAGIASGAQPQGTANVQQAAEELAQAHSEAQEAQTQQDDDPLGGLDDLDADQLDGVLDTDDADVDLSQDDVDLSQDEDVSPDQIAEVIEGVLDLDNGFEGPDDLLAVIEDLLEDLTSQPLIQVFVGPTESAAQDANDVTSADASAQGAVVVVVPTEQSTRQNPRGLLTLELGAASVSVSSDRSSASADFDPALARIGITNPLTGDFDEIPIEPGVSECVGAAPLELCISVGDGETSVQNGGAAASANGVSITALGDPLPQLGLDLAAATAAVNAAAAVDDVEPVEPRPELPVTGGGALLPGLLLLGAGTAGFVGLRRRG